MHATSARINWALFATRRETTNSLWLQPCPPFSSRARSFMVFEMRRFKWVSMLICDYQPRKFQVRIQCNFFVTLLKGTFEFFLRLGQKTFKNSISAFCTVTGLARFFWQNTHYSSISVPEKRAQKKWAAAERRRVLCRRAANSTCCLELIIMHSIRPSMCVIIAEFCCSHLRLYQLTRSFSSWNISKCVADRRTTQK